MPPLTRRTALLALPPAMAAALSAPQSNAADAPHPTAPTLSGAYALPDGQPKVAATLTATPKAGGPPGTRVLEVAMTRRGSSQLITHYQTELSKQLHLIAVSGDLRTFVHSHGDRPDGNGRFRVPMTFPHGGLWHVYADAVPVGLGQQVMRFDLDLGGEPSGPQPPPEPSGLEGADGRYGVRFDTLDLQAGQDAELNLHLLRDGQPAPDVTPYLGVAAHAVFISAANLTYVHAHAAPAAAPTAGGMETAMQHDMTAAAGMDMPGIGHPGGEHGAMPGMGGAPMRPGTKVAPDLTLHVHASKAGTYLLWLQFMAGGQVRTVPFTARVA